VCGNDFGRQRQQLVALVGVVHFEDPTVSLISKYN
jgi:hypothetical protein